MFRFSYRFVALTLAALLFCTGCQIRIGFPDPTTSEEMSSPPAPAVPSATTSASAHKTDRTNPSTSTPQASVTDAPPETTTAPPPDTAEPSVPKKQVAFTFDDGPHNTLTYKFVDKLEEYDASATFFIVGDRVTKAGGAAIAYAAENGCEIGIHSYSHAADLYYHVCSEAEYFADMQKTADAINKYVPAPVTLMRPPGGNITSARVQSCPYGVILWNVDSEDWRYKGRADEATAEANINTIVENVMKSVKDGSIVLMHEIYENSYQAFCILIDRLYEEGYEVVSVSKLLGDSLQPGQKYSRK